jgi:hypothetical protein
MKKEIIIVSSLVLSLVLFSVFYPLFSDNVKTCNDGTLYDNCSKINPYFCSNGVLTENASICGCNNFSMISGDKCVSDFQTEPKNITLNYVLRGKKGQINFTVYKKLYDFDSGISRYISTSKNPTLLDFKLKFINEPYQREFLLPLIIQIENLARNREDQMRITVSLVQNIPFGNSDKTIQIGDSKIEYQRYPYEVLYDMQGICSEKSELLILLLREIGYGSAFLYYNLENHEAVGINCPKEESLNNTGYCFVETTGPSIITDDKTEYVGGIFWLNSVPQILIASDGISLGKNLYEYRDARILMGVKESIRKYGTINPFQSFQFKNLKQKYGLIAFNNSYTF